MPAYKDGPPMHFADVLTEVQIPRPQDYLYLDYFRKYVRNYARDSYRILHYVYYIICYNHSKYLFFDLEFLNIFRGKCSN